MRFYILLITVLIIAGCVQEQPKNQITEVSIPGHPVYTFSNPINEAMKYSITDKDEIHQAILKTRNLNIVFNGSSVEDNTYFQVVLFNVVTKIQTFFVYEHTLLRVNSYYFIGDQWYNLTNTTSMPNLTGTTLWVKGPNTGATENSLSFANNTIYLQGLSYKNLTLAGDRLVLLVLGV